MDTRALRDELTDAFIHYQHRLDCPFPSDMETTDGIIQKYRTDHIFHAKVMSLVSGVMCIVDKHAAELATLREKAARLENELETERMRLAACGAWDVEVPK